MMKTPFRLIISCCALLQCLSCSVQDPEAFDRGSSYLYFNMPFVTDAYGRSTGVRQDSLSYSFAFDDPSVSEYTFNIPVAIMGMPADYDREFRIEVVREETSATAADWDENTLQHAVLEKGQVFINLPIKVKRNEGLQKEAKQFVLKLLPNEHFSMGDHDLLQVRVVFSDILNEPSWWKSYLSRFGPFYKEIYRKWRDVYPLGADDGINYDNDQLLYWDNMPSFFIESWYPVLAMHIQILKQYFIDNVVYPDGDSSKPRILLPN